MSPSIIYNISDPDIPWEKLAYLMREAFKERTEQGLLFACRDFSAEDLKNDCSNHDKALLFVKNDDNNNPLGLIVMTIKNNVGNTNYVVASPSAKHSGICSSLFKDVLKKSKELHLNHLISSTSTGATSSINWHLKMGFKKYDYHSSKHTNYYSVIFRLPLKEKNTISYNIKRLLHFNLAKIFVTITKTPDGSWRFPFLIKIWRKIKNQLNS